MSSIRDTETVVPLRAAASTGTMSPVNRALVLVLCLAPFGCRAERPAAGGGPLGTCTIEPQPLRRGSIVRTHERTSEVIDLPARGKEPAVHRARGLREGEHPKRPDRGDELRVMVVVPHLVTPDLPGL